MLVWFNVYFLVNKFKELRRGYGLVDLEIFCVVINEGGILISAADFIIVGVEVNI